MKLYSENKDYKLYNGNMLDLLQVVEENTVDSIVTDPPYELNFMNKGWDNSGIAFQKKTWEQCYKALKPGGYLLAFGGTRTFHRIACAIEDVGFEIRDTIMWLYGSGFPKSMNIGLAIDKKNGVESKVVGHSTNGSGAQSSKLVNHTKGCTGIGYADGSGKEFDIKQAQNEWDGWGTCLKPSYEPIIVARKPVENGVVENVMKYGVGGINIDECRVGTGAKKWSIPKGGIWNPSVDNGAVLEDNPKGRFPANTILTYDETDYEEVCGGFPTSNKPNGSLNKEYECNNNIYGDMPNRVKFDSYQDCGSAARYFYCAKASKKDRDEGLDELESKTRFQQGNYSQSPVCSVCGKTFNGTNDHSSCGEHTMTYKSKEENKVRKNIHPTVKPTELMQYLIKLVTPKNGTILDPFNGSGSTGKAVMYENLERNINYKYIGIELTEEYLPIAKARIEYVCELPRKDKEKTSIIDLLGD